MNAACSNKSQLKFPFDIKSVDPIVNERLLKDFTGNIFNYFGQLFLERVS